LIFSEEIIENGNMPILKPRAITLFYFFRISFNAAPQHKEMGHCRLAVQAAADSAVIDSRYKPARQRETLGGSTSGLTHSSAAKRRLKGA
jgi:hypothetical protein